MNEKELYRNMLGMFKGLGFPLVVFGLKSDDGVEFDGFDVLPFESRWLADLESEMTPRECEQLHNEIDRVCRTLARPLLRMMDGKGLSPTWRLLDD